MQNRIHIHTHARRHARTNKSEKNPKPIETRISQNQKNSQSENNYQDVQYQNFYNNLVPKLQEEQSAKKENNFRPK